MTYLGTSSAAVDGSRTGPDRMMSGLLARGRSSRLPAWTVLSGVRQGRFSAAGGSACVTGRVLTMARRRRRTVRRGSRP